MKTMYWIALGLGVLFVMKKKPKDLHGANSSKIADIDLLTTAADTARLM